MARALTAWALGGLIMDKTQLDIIKLRWQVLILQTMSVNLFVAVFAGMGVSRAELLQRILKNLDQSQQDIYRVLLAPTLQEHDGSLLAEEFAQIVEQMKSSLTSMLTAS